MIGGRWSALAGIGPDLRAQLRTYVEQIAAEGRAGDPPSLDGELTISWDRWRRFHVVELSAAEQAARVCACLMPERMLALLEAELEKTVELELTSIALPAERRWHE